MTSRYSDTADLTARQAPVSPGCGPLLLSFMCGHKGPRAGAFMRGYLPYRCARCCAERKAA